ncbi:MAG TPA: DUF4388 domain-containing protein [Thermoanaerobaculia bacterium]|nr:DUF4388 domain-containing protein [Thermoanaerobaculia bacterium]
MNRAGSLLETPLTQLLAAIREEGAHGVLRIAHGVRRARIELEDGVPVSARAPGVPRLGDVLVSRGLADPITVQEAARIQAEERSGRRLGEILIGIGILAQGDLAAAVRWQLEQTMSELATWKTGRFELEPAVPAPLAREATRAQPAAPVDRAESTRPAAGPLEPPRTDEPAEDEPQAVHSTANQGTRVPAAAPWPAVDVDVSSDDAAWLLKVRGAIPPAAETPGSPRRPRILICDHSLLGELASRPGLAPDGIVAVVDAFDQIPAAYRRGANAAVPRELAVALGATRQLAEALCGFARPAQKGRARAADRSGPGTASLMLSLLESVSHQAERGVLFLARGSSLVAVGAFGMHDDGHRLAERVRLMRLAIADAGLLGIVCEDGIPRCLDLRSDPLPRPFVEGIGVPCSHEAAILPITGELGPIGIVYLDHGSEARQFGDLTDLAEIVSTFAHSLETEFLIGEIAKVLG